MSDARDDENGSSRDDRSEFEDVAGTAFARIPSYLTAYSGPSGEGKAWRGFGVCVLLSLAGLAFFPIAFVAVYLSARAALHHAGRARLALAIAIASSLLGVFLMLHFT